MVRLIEKLLRLRMEGDAGGFTVGSVGGGGNGKSWMSLKFT